MQWVLCQLVKSGDIARTCGVSARRGWFQCPATCAVLCCAVLLCAVLVLCCAVLCCASARDDDELVIWFERSDVGELNSAHIRNAAVGALRGGDRRQPRAPLDGKVTQYDETSVAGVRRRHLPPSTS